MLEEDTYQSCSAFVDDALGAIAIYGTAEYVENRGLANFNRLVASLREISSTVIFPILSRLVSPDGSFNASDADSVDAEYFATGEDLFPLFVAHAAANPAEHTLLKGDAIYSDVADQVIREVAPHLAPERLDGEVLEVVLDFTDHLEVTGREALVDAFAPVLGAPIRRLFGKSQDRDLVFQEVKAMWGGRPVKFIVTGKRQYELRNREYDRDPDWFWFGMKGLFAGIRGVEVINRTKHD